MNFKEHWNQVYQTKGLIDVSWHQTRPTLSFDLIDATRAHKDSPNLAVGYLHVLGDEPIHNIMVYLRALQS